MLFVQVLSVAREMGAVAPGWDQDSRQCQLSQEHASKNPAMVRDNRHD